LRGSPGGGLHADAKGSILAAMREIGRQMFGGPEHQRLVDVEAEMIGRSAHLVGVDLAHLEGVGRIQVHRTGILPASFFQ
jgi:hypothetical protein